MGRVRVFAGTYDGGLLGYCYDEDSKSQLDTSEKKLLDRDFRTEAHVGCVKAVGVCERWLATGGSDETIKVIDLLRRKEHGVLHHHSSAVTTLVFHNSSHMLSGAQDGSLAIWKCSNWEVMHSMSCKHPLVDLALHPSGKMALSLCSVTAPRRRTLLQLWNLMNGRCALNIETHDADLVQWSDDGSSYALAHGTTVSLFRTEDCSETHTLDFPAKIVSMVLRADGLVVGCEDHVIYVRRGEDYSDITQYTGHRSRVRGLVSLGQSGVVSASSDGTVCLWDTAMQRQAITLVSGRVTAFSARVEGGAETSEQPRKKKKKSTKSQGEGTEKQQGKDKAHDPHGKDKEPAKRRRETEAARAEKKVGPKKSKKPDGNTSKKSAKGGVKGGAIVKAKAKGDEQKFKKRKMQ